MTALSVPPEIIDADETKGIEIGIALEDILNKANTKDIEYTILKINLSIESSYYYYNKLFANQGYSIYFMNSSSFLTVDYITSVYVRGLSVIGLICIEGQESNYVAYTITNILTANELSKQFGIEQPD